MSLLGEGIHQVNHPPTCTSFYHSQGALKVFWFTNLSWYIAGFVTKLIAKFQNAQVAYSSPKIAMQVSHMPAISPAREANVATHAWIKLNDEFTSLTVSGAYECRSCHA